MSYCKQLKKIYNPVIYWCPVNVAWIGKFNTKYGRAPKVLGFNNQQATDRLERFFNKYLLGYWKADQLKSKLSPLDLADNRLPSAPIVYGW